MSISRVQRQACLAITGALKTTSNDSLNIFLGISPVENFIVEVAALAALRIRCLGLLVMKSYGHTTVLNKFNINQHVKYDHLSPIYNFDQRSSVDIPPRDGWRSSALINSADVVIYTDGSKSVYGCGAGFHVENYNANRCFKLPNDSSIIQCEIFAITQACEFVKCMDFTGKSIIIFSDCQMALKLILSNSIKSTTVRDCTKALNEISSENIVRLMWVPGHSDVEGNHIADMLAKQGANLHISYLSKNPIPLSAAKLKIQELGEEKWLEKWNSISSNKVSKTLWPRLQLRFSKFILTLDRSSLKRIVQALSGHMTVGRHALRMGIPSHPTCLCCETPAEEVDSFHYWCFCSTLSLIRSKYLGSYFFPSIESLRIIDLSDKINYILNSYWFLG